MIGFWWWRSDGVRAGDNLCKGGSCNCCKSALRVGVVVMVVVVMVVVVVFVVVVMIVALVVMYWGWRICGGDGGDRQWK